MGILWLLLKGSMLRQEMWEGDQAVWWVPFPGTETKSLELIQGGFCVCFTRALCSPRVASNSKSSCLGFRRTPMEEEEDQADKNPWDFLVN